MAGQIYVNLLKQNTSKKYKNYDNTEKYNYDETTFVFSVACKSLELMLSLIMGGVR